MHPKQGTDAALAMAMGHVALKEFYFNRRSAYFDDYARRYTDLPLLLRLKDTTLADGSKVLAPGRYVRASDFADKLGQDNNPEWKSVAFDAAGQVVRAERLDRFPLGRRTVAPTPASGISRPRKARSARRREAQALGTRGRGAEARSRRGRVPLLRRREHAALSEQLAAGAN